jgi:hypothetical protein
METATAARKEGARDDPQRGVVLVSGGAAPSLGPMAGTTWDMARVAIATGGKGGR